MKMTARELAQMKVGEAPPERLCQLRENYGLSVNDVAHALHIHPNYYRRVEQGLSVPGVVVGLKLARFFETTIEELFGYLLESKP